MFVPDSGQQTILYYNPENPHMIYVPAENQTSVSTILKIIGIAGDRQEAVELVAEIIKEVYDNTGETDVAGYLEKMGGW